MEERTSQLIYATSAVAKTKPEKNSAKWVKWELVILGVLNIPLRDE